MVEAGNTNVESGNSVIKPDSDSLETDEGKVAEPEVCPDSEGAKLPEHSGEGSTSLTDPHTQNPLTCIYIQSMKPLTSVYFVYPNVNH